MRKPILPVVALVLVVLLSACDTSPASPTPFPTPTTAPPTTAPTTAPTSAPTTAPTTAPTSTTQSSSEASTPTGVSSAGGQATRVTSSNGKLGVAPQGSFAQVKQPTAKGDIANKTITIAKGDTPFTSSQPARATVTRPSSRPTATEVPPSDSGVLPDGWNVVLDSDFSTGDAGTWLTGESGNISASVGNGTYNMIAKNGAGFYTWSDETSDWTDGYISATLKITGSGYGGLVSRLAKNNDQFTNIVCMISNAGKYGCYSEVAGKVAVISENSSTAIKRNATNTLALMAVGTDFTFYINGKGVETFQNTDVTEGAWGAYMETPENSTTTAAFSHIVFIGPGEAAPTTVPGDTATTEPTQEATETTAPTQQATTAPTRPSTSRTPGRTATVSDKTPTTTGSTIVSTDFSQDAGTWYTGAGDGFSVSVTGGNLVLDYSNPNGIVATSSDETVDLTDARLEATLTIKDTSRSKPGFVGISARGQEFASNFQDWAQVFCGINNNSAYTCDRLTTASDGTINFTELLHGKTSSIAGNKENTIALTGRGNRWTFEVNGTKVGSFTDNSQTHGAWGVMVDSGDATTTGMFSKISAFKP